MLIGDGVEMKVHPKNSKIAVGEVACVHQMDGYYIGRVTKILDENFFHMEKAIMMKILRPQEMPQELLEMYQANPSIQPVGFTSNPFLGPNWEMDVNLGQCLKVLSVPDDLLKTYLAKTSGVVTATVAEISKIVR